MEKKTVFKDLSAKAKIQYIWDYYKIPIFAVLCAAAFIVSLIVHYASLKETVLNVIMINTLNPFEENNCAADEFFSRQGFDPNSEEIILDNSLTILEDDSSTSTYNNQKLFIKFAAGEADILFAPEFLFEQYAERGILMPLSDYLTEDELTAYSDFFVYGADPVTEEIVPCGIKLTQNNWLSEHGYYPDTIYFGIACNTAAKETAVDFFHYITE